MTAPHLPDSDREQQLNDILLAYVEAVEAGQEPDRRQLLSRYPDFADELIEFFASRDQVERLAAPLRSGSGWRGAGGEKRVGGGMDHASPSTLHPPPAALGELGDFQLIREIGRGGMGVVYEARQISLNRTVALKVLPFAAALDPKHLQRFKNEAQAAAQLHHSNIVPVYAVGAERGVHYYAMQLIEGQSLAAMIAELRQLAFPLGGDNPPGEGTHGDSARVYQLLTGQLQSLNRAESPDEKTGPYFPLSTDPEAPAHAATTQALAAVTTERSIRSRRYFHRVARLVLKAAEALEHAHQMGIIHRDVKPANLLVDHNGTLWVTDFGLALYRGDAGLTMSGELLGTLRYMSPEQAMAKRALVDHRTDIYSLGVTLYELLTLEPAFTGSDRQELLRQIGFEEPSPPRKLDRSIPVELETIVLKAIAKTPAERYTTAQELADDLQRFLDDKPIKARRPTLLETATKWSRRHRPLVWSALGGLVVTAVALLVSTVLTIRAYDREKQKAQEAEANLQDARIQRNRAEASFLLAREAVDLLSNSVQEGLADKPALEDLRRKCLREALRYYKGFIEQRGDDPAIQQELEASYAKVATILSDLGEMPAAVDFLDKGIREMEKRARRYPSEPRPRWASSLHHQVFALQGGFKFNLLGQPDVQKDLQLTGDQLGKINQFTQRLQDQRSVLHDLMRRPTPDEWNQKYQEFTEANQKEMAAILTPEQVERLGQLSIRSLGVNAFREPTVLEKLGLSDTQNERLKKILEGGHRLREILRWYSVSDGSPDAVRQIAERVKNETTEKALQILREDQLDQWKHLVGKPFQGEFFRGPGGGPEGGPPRRP